MSTEIVVAILSLLGTALGTGGGLIASARLTNYKIGQLEKKVDKHNQLIERTYKLEEKDAVQDEKIEYIGKSFNDLKNNLGRFLQNEKRS